ncbi:MAG: GlsB/YeaQ/YmgE family stress response membrane protein [Solirubrobacterales bacterium]|nr:GlsB/YeaQ/YmgE family stress response membrane protein [Solirubrobacterales bacterium]
MLGLIVFIVLWGLFVGAMARLAVPGPDPMPLWLTCAVGLAGSIAGGLVARALVGNTGGFLSSFACAVLLVIAYRRFVQGRTVTGPGAQLPPRRD